MLQWINFDNYRLQEIRICQGMLKDRECCFYPQDFTKHLFEELSKYRKSSYKYQPEADVTNVKPFLLTKTLLC